MHQVPRSWQEGLVAHSVDWMPVKALARGGHHLLRPRARLMLKQTRILPPKSSVRRRLPGLLRKWVTSLPMRVCLVGIIRIPLGRQDRPANASVKTRRRPTTGQHPSIGLGCLRLHQASLPMYYGLVASLGLVSLPWTKFRATNMPTCSPIPFANVTHRATRPSCWARLTSSPSGRQSPPETRQLLPPPPRFQGAILARAASGSPSARSWCLHAVSSTAHTSSASSSTCSPTPSCTTLTRAVVQAQRS